MAPAPSDADQLYDDLGDPLGLLLEERDAVTGGLVGSATARLHKRRAEPRGTVRTRRSRRPMILAGAALVLVAGGAAAVAFAGGGGGGGSSRAATPATGSATAAATATGAEQPAAAPADVSAQIAAIAVPAAPIRIAYQIPAGVVMPSVPFNDGFSLVPYPLDISGTAIGLTCRPDGTCVITFGGTEAPLAAGNAHFTQRLVWSKPEDPCPGPPPRQVTVRASGSTTIDGVTVPAALAVDVHEQVSHWTGKKCVELRPDRVQFTARQLT
jgi:hypothetical protein